MRLRISIKRPSVCVMCCRPTRQRRESGVIPADNLVPEKARILLQIALSKTSDPKEIARIFNEY